MRKKVTQEIQVYISMCNICGKEVTTEPFNKERIKFIKGLFKLQDFDAHEACINRTTRLAFKKYV